MHVSRSSLRGLATTPTRVRSERRQMRFDGTLNGSNLFLLFNPWQNSWLQTKIYFTIINTLPSVQMTNTFLFNSLFRKNRNSDSVNCTREGIASMVRDGPYSFLWHWIGALQLEREHFENCLQSIGSRWHLFLLRTQFHGLIGSVLNAVENYDTMWSIVFSLCRLRTPSRPTALFCCMHYCILATIVCIRIHFFGQTQEQCTPCDRWAIVWLPKRCSVNKFFACVSNAFGNAFTEFLFLPPLWEIIIYSMRRE